MAACPAPGSLTEWVLQSEVSCEADTRIARQHALEGSAGALEMAVGLAPALNVVGSGYVGVTASVPAVMVATMLLMLAGSVPVKGGGVVMAPGATPEMLELAAPVALEPLVRVRVGVLLLAALLEAWRRMGCSSAATSGRAAAARSTPVEKRMAGDGTGRDV